jgi:hypothetical protein
MNARSTVKEAKLLATAAAEVVKESDRNLNVAVGLNITRAAISPAEASTFIRKYKESLNSFLEGQVGEFAINIIADFSDNKQLQELVQQQQAASSKIIEGTRQRYQGMKQLEAKPEPAAEVEVGDGATD